MRRRVGTLGARSRSASVYGVRPIGAWSQEIRCNRTAHIGFTLAPCLPVEAFGANSSFMKLRPSICVAAVLLAAAAIVAWRGSRWSIAGVRDLSDNTHRRLRVEIATRGEVPWPLRLSVAAVDSGGKRIESSLPRWEARQVGPNTVALTFAERITDGTQPVRFDLKIAAAGHSALRVEHSLGRDMLEHRQAPKL